MKIYFAGGEGGSYNKILLREGVKNRLESFFYLKKEPPSVREFQSHLLDSGGYTARVKGVEIGVETFAAYCNQHGAKLAFNLDTNDIDETLRNQKFLETHAPKTYFIPIYHLSDYCERRELLHDFLRYPFIAVGGVAGVGGNKQIKEAFYKYVFRHTRDRVKVHGLGITDGKSLERYPWYSVDSSSWLSFARYGNSKNFTDKKMMQYTSRTKHYHELAAMEVQHYLRMQKFITDLWKKRGVVWND